MIEHPLHERLLGQLMLALHRCGRRAVYRDVRQRLVDELEIEPGQALRRLHQQLLADEPDSPVRSAGPDSPPARPSPPPPRESAAPLAAPVAARPAELPRDVRGFVAREAELAWLEECLGGGDGVCVLSGTAGMGKTALALHWAHQAADRFPDGQLYIDLRGYDSDHEPLTAAVALTRLLASLGVDPDQAPGGFEDRLGLYRSLLARRSVLLFLDNARSAAQVLPLLPPAGAVLLADAGLHLGLTAEAEDSLNLADELIAASGLRWHSAYSSIARARLRSAVGDHEGAVRHALKGRDVSIEASYRLPELAALTELAVLERRRGEDEAAARMATQALRLCREIGHAPCEEKLAPFLQA
ncbi:BTAD domain-containing putative transcriptional regulator [Nonomuraea roseola]|uniref:BTAD domain-containing putative transcriptional regulator n=1 Tax=Nonomuraea roseola TaxID=46179 RepID=A0ABV5Q4L0_9ACTN